MTRIQYISVTKLCDIYEIEMSFFRSLSKHGLLEIEDKQDDILISESLVDHTEKMIRLHRDLQLNIEGIAAVMDLLQRIEFMQNELAELRGRLRMYESE